MWGCETLSILRMFFWDFAAELGLSWHERVRGDHRDLGTGSNSGAVGGWPRGGLIVGNQKWGSLSCEAPPERCKQQTTNAVRRRCGDRRCYRLASRCGSVAVSASRCSQEVVG
jgi:hypothetical protein